MSLDECGLTLRVEGWSQTISHDSGRALRFRARTQEDVEIEIAPEGKYLSNILVDLSVIQGKPSKVLERGIGRINYHPERAPAYDRAGIEEFVGGWFWLPEEYYDEVWAQVREGCYQASTVDIEFGPIGSSGPAFKWDTSAAPAFITAASIRFDTQLV